MVNHSVVLMIKKLNFLKKILWSNLTWLWNIVKLVQIVPRKSILFYNLQQDPEWIWFIMSKNFKNSKIFINHKYMEKQILKQKL